MQADGNGGLGGLEFSKEIERFLGFLRDAEAASRAAAAIEKEAGDATQDILHFLELGEPGYHARARAAEALRRERKKRKAAKNAAEQAAPILEWAGANERAVRMLEKALGAARNAEKNAASRAYASRTGIEAAFGEKGDAKDGKP
jgi:hypothetical protein